jgi:tRNA-uridine 2-sulfurtransferase
MKKASALVLLSGGLDSILAAELLRRQGVDVQTLSFKSYFFNEEAAKKAAENLNISLRVVDFSKEHLRLVKKPPRGYGKSMNPCIDCHALMLKKAKEIMEKEKFDFVATGEVLGERPMSQNKQSLAIVEKESSLKGRLLRPLSAKLLEPTVPEKEGLVDRDLLMDISGRSRKKQIEMARDWEIEWYPAPAGGCLLTDPLFGKKLKELLERYTGFDGDDVQLLKIGRHFWEKGNKIVVGRNKEENERIKELAQKGDVLIEMKDYPGPLTLVRNYSSEETGSKVIDKAKKLTQDYSAKAKGRKNVVFLVDKLE